MAQLLGDCVYPTKESQGRLCVKTPAGSYPSCKVTRREYLGISAKCKNTNFVSWTNTTSQSNLYLPLRRTINQIARLPKSEVGFRMFSAIHIWPLFPLNLKPKNLNWGPESFPFFWWLSGRQLFSRQFWRYNRTQFWKSKTLIELSCNWIPLFQWLLRRLLPNCVCTFES